ncbi:MAG: hypothetical protein COA58_04205 [Bacteroidetes bacterium]|nr:MAG: hypothetical protein COA58_04205 [Bacteroidota bacterium]
MKYFGIILVSLFFLGCSDDMNLSTDSSLRYSCDKNSFTVTPEILDPDSIRLALPTTFSPDGNFFNDLFRPFLSRDADYQMSIFKNGELIQDSLDLAWDGKKANGDTYGNGVYDYTIKLRNGKGKEFSIKGKVSLNAYGKQVCGCKYEDMFNPDIWEFSNQYSEGCDDI